MTITNYNITLKRVDSKDLELLRTWRNSDYVKTTMLYSEYITEEMQKKWFESIDNNQNFYFIAEFQNKKVGVINVKNIQNNSGEGGIYLASDEFENTDIVSRMVLCFNDFLFNELKLDYLYSHVKRDNKKASSSSKAQGCIENFKKSTEHVIQFKLLPENYNSKTKKIKTILNK